MMATANAPTMSAGELVIRDSWLARSGPCVGWDLRRGVIGRNEEKVHRATGGLDRRNPRHSAGRRDSVLLGFRWNLCQLVATPSFDDTDGKLSASW
jgi:hypothetical protein